MAFKYTPPAAVELAGAPPIFAKLDRAERERALQGPWLIRGALQRALEIEGDDVTLYDGDKVRHGRLDVVAPCQAGIAVDNIEWNFALAFKDGKAVLAKASPARR